MSDDSAIARKLAAALDDNKALWARVGRLEARLKAKGVHHLDDLSDMPAGAFCRPRNPPTAEKWRRAPWRTFQTSACKRLSSRYLSKPTSRACVRLLLSSE